MLKFVLQGGRPCFPWCSTWSDLGSQPGVLRHQLHGGGREHQPEADRDHRQVRPIAVFNLFCCLKIYFLKPLAFRNISPSLESKTSFVQINFILSLYLPTSDCLVQYDAFKDLDGVQVAEADVAHHNCDEEPPQRGLKVATTHSGC